MDGVRAATSLVGGAVAGMAEDFIQAQQVEAQLNAVLESTAGVSGMTAASVLELSNSLSRVAPFEDELITKTQNMLLTFTNVGAEVFPQATEAALNMATAMGEDPVQAALRLGRALNDPVEGVTALRRVGVQLSDAQRDVIASLVETGDVAGAQAIILQELETEFGNSARAAGTTFAGQMTILNTQLGNVKEVIGGAFIPILQQLLTVVTPLIQAFGDWLPGALEDAGRALAPIGRMIEDLQESIAGFAEVQGLSVLDATLAALSQTLATVFGPNTALLFDRFTQAVGDAISTVTGLFAGFETSSEDALTGLPALVEAASTAIVAAFATIGPAVAGLGAVFDTLKTSWTTALTGLATAVTLAMQGDIATAFATFGTVVTGTLTDALTLVTDYVPQFAAGWAELVAGALERFAELAPEVMAGLLNLLNELLAWILDAVPRIAAQFAEWIPPAIEWVATAAQGLLTSLLGLLGQVLVWIAASAGPLASTILGEWVPALVGWVLGTALPNLLGALASLLGTVVNWLVTGGAEQILTAAVALGTAIVTGVLEGAAALGGMLKTWIETELPKHISALTTFVQTEGAKLGGDILAGILKGLNPETLATNLKNMATGGLQAAATAIEAHSPSEMAARVVGEPMIQGIIAGLARKQAELTAETERLATAAVDAAAMATERAMPRFVGAWGGAAEAVAWLADAIPESYPREVDDMVVDTERALIRFRSAWGGASELVEWLSNPVPDAYALELDGMVSDTQEATYQLRLGWAGANDFMVQTFGPAGTAPAALAATSSVLTTFASDSRQKFTEAKTAVADFASSVVLQLGDGGPVPAAMKATKIEMGKLATGVATDVTTMKADLLSLKTSIQTDLAAPLAALGPVLTEAERNAAPLRLTLDALDTSIVTTAQDSVTLTMATDALGESLTRTAQDSITLTVNTNAATDAVKKLKEAVSSFPGTTPGSYPQLPPGTPSGTPGPIQPGTNAPPGTTPRIIEQPYAHTGGGVSNVHNHGSFQHTHDGGNRPHSNATGHGSPPSPGNPTVYMAQGGLVTHPLMAMLGENPLTRPEIVSPVQTLREITGQEIARALRAGGGGAPIIIQGDVYGERDFLDKLARAAAQYRARNGRSF